LVMSATSYGALSGETDKALLLVHRSLDLYLHSLAAGLGVIREGAEGLAYSHGGKKDVTLDRTKNLLLSSSSVHLPKEHLLRIDRINYLRNRSFLTHSMYGLDKTEIENYLAYAHKFIKFAEGDDTTWQRDVRIFLSKPDVADTDIFINEDSFESYIQENTY